MLAAYEQTQKVCALGFSNNNEMLLHYRIDACVGEGGFGEVFAAWDTKLHRKVAIKKLKSASDKANLLHEARRAVSLHHPSFVQVFSIESADLTQFIVMEYVDGITLREKINTQQISLNEALCIFNELFTAIEFAHRKKLVHGDLKPSNIMCEPSGALRILDFGLARRLESDDTAPLNANAMLGTIAYTAPERILGAELSYASDIFALGIILYELLTAKKPFPFLTGAGLSTAYLQCPAKTWEWKEDIPSQIIELVEAMTFPQPNQRAARALTLINTNKDPVLLFEALKIKRPPKNNFLLQWKILAPTLVFFLIAVTLYLKPVDPTSLELFSEASAMKNGLQAIAFYDRPGQLDLAEREFSNITKRNPNHAGAIAGLAITNNYRYISDLEDSTWLRKAHAGAQLALSLNPHLSLSHIASAQVLGFEGKYREAMEEIDQALKLDPDNILALKTKGDLLIRAGKYDDAVIFAENNLKRHPHERLFADQVGYVQYLKGNYSAAEAAFRNSIAIEPDAIFSYANLNGTLMAEGKDEEALKVLQEGLQIRSSSQLLGNLGNTLFMRNDFLGAAAAFRQQVSSEMGNPLDHQGWMNLGDILQIIPGQTVEAHSAYERAHNLIERKLGQDTESAWLLAKWALLFAKINPNLSNDKEKFKLAKDAATLALNKAANNSEIHMDVAAMFELSGDRSAALKEVITSIKLGYPITFIDANPDFTNLRRDSAYQLILTENLIKSP
ncbi:MAG: protein kinase [Pseudomonadota bacterium]